MFVVKFFLILTLFLILIQDYKERKVYWFLYPIIGVLVYILQFDQNGFEVSIINSTMNLCFVVLILLVAYFYNLIKLKLKFLKEVFGLGDVLFFAFISFSFATVSFIILFVFSLVFSLLLHEFFKKKSHYISIPLAGYMSLFFGIIYLLSFVVSISFLYAV